MDADAVDAMKAEIRAIEDRRQAAKLAEEKAAEHRGGDIGSSDGGGG